MPDPGSVSVDRDQDKDRDWFSTLEDTELSSGMGGTGGSTSSAIGFSTMDVPIDSLEEDTLWTEPTALVEEDEELEEEPSDEIELEEDGGEDLPPEGPPADGPADAPTDGGGTDPALSGAISALQSVDSSPATAESGAGGGTTGASVTAETVNGASGGGNRPGATGGGTSGSQGPMSLLELGPACFVTEEWGAQDPVDRASIDLVPLMPSPAGATPHTGVRGATDPATALAEASSGQAFYSEDQRSAIAGQALADGAKGGLATAGIGIGMDVLGFGAARGSQALLKTGTMAGKAAGAAAGTAIPIIGGVMAGVNLYNTISAWDSNFSQPWGTLANSEAPGLERLAAGLDLLSTVLGVLSDVLGIVAAVLAVASVVTAIVGVGLALGAVTGAITVASLATAALSLVVSGIAAGVRYYQIVEGKGDPTEVAAQAEKLKAHTANALGQTGGLVSAAGQNHIESRGQVKTGQSSADADVSPGVVAQGEGLAPAPAPPDSAVQAIAPSDPGSIGTGPKAGDGTISPAPAADVGTVGSVEPPTGVAIDLRTDLQGLVLPRQPSVDTSTTIVTPGPNELRQFGGMSGNLEAHKPGSLITDLTPDQVAKFSQTDVRSDIVAQDFNTGGRSASEIPQGAGADHLRQSGWTDGEIARFQEITVKDPGQMSPSEVGQLGEGRQILHQTLQEGTEMSKVLSPGDETPFVMKPGDDGFTKGDVRGFVAKAETTRGMDAEGTIDALALTYQDKSGQQPYLPGGKATDQVSVGNFKLTAEQQAKAAVPTDPRLQPQFEARGIPTKAQQNQGPADPFTGTGGPGSKTVGNEYVLPPTKHMPGDTVSRRGKNGDQTLGTIQGILGADGQPLNDRRWVQKQPQPGDLILPPEKPAAAPETGPTPSTPPSSSAPASKPDPKILTANQIATTTSLLQNAVTPDLELPEPEKVFPDPGSLASVSTGSSPAPVYDYATAETVAPPVAEVVGLEELPAPPHDPRVVASHAPVVAGLVAREELMLSQVSLLDGILSNFDQVLGPEGPYSAMEQDQANREATFAEQVSHVEAVDTGIGEGEAKAEELKEKQSEAQGEQGDLAGSGAVEKVLGVTSNGAVRGLVNVGGGIAKAGAAIVNGVGELFGADEPVIDTSTIDKLMELFASGPRLKASYGQVQGKSGATGNAAGGMEQMVDARRTELDTVEADNQLIEADNQKIEQQTEAARSTAESEKAEHEAERQEDLAHLGDVRGAKANAASVYDAEMAALSAWYGDYAATVARNEERIAAANAAAAAPALTGEQQAEVDARLAQIDNLLWMRDVVGSDLHALADQQRASAEAANGLSFPGSYGALADSAVAGFQASFDGAVTPVLLQMQADLGSVTPDRVHTLCLAVDQALDQVVAFIQAERDCAAATITAVFIRLDRPPELQEEEFRASLPAME